MALEKQIIAPEHTAVRVALWRALHVQIDHEPHILVDEIGLKLIAENDWRSRPEMDPAFSKGSRHKKQFDCKQTPIQRSKRPWRVRTNGAS